MHHSAVTSGKAILLEQLGEDGFPPMMNNTVSLTASGTRSEKLCMQHWPHFEISVSDSHGLDGEECPLGIKILCQREPRDSPSSITVGKRCQEIKSKRGMILRVRYRCLSICSAVVAPVISSRQTSNRASDDLVDILRPCGRTSLLDMCAQFLCATCESDSLVVTVGTSSPRGTQTSTQCVDAIYRVESEVPRRCRLAVHKVDEIDFNKLRTMNDALKRSRRLLGILHSEYTIAYMLTAG